MTIESGILNKIAGVSPKGTGLLGRRRVHQVKLFNKCHIGEPDPSRLGGVKDGNILQVTPLECETCFNQDKPNNITSSGAKHLLNHQDFSKTDKQ